MDLRERAGELPDRMHLLKLRPRNLWGIQSGAVKKVRGRFAQWRKTAGVEAGVYGIRLEANSSAVVLLAIPADRPIPRTSIAFEVTTVDENCSRSDFVDFLKMEYWDEMTAWQSEDELESLLEEVKGRRRYQGFGPLYTRRDEVEEAGATEGMPAEAIPQSGVGSNRILAGC